MKIFEKIKKFLKSIFGKKILSLNEPININENLNSNLRNTIVNSKNDFLNSIKINQPSKNGVAILRKCVGDGCGIDRKIVN